MATALFNDDLLVRQTYRDLISGLHILHYHGVLDAYGHLSVRHPRHPDRFIMSRYIAPATVTSERDLVEYYTSDAEPVDPNAPKGYAERCIHSELYKRYRHVHAVVHSHSDAVVPFAVSGVPFQPCYAMAGFLGTRTPVFDIARHYERGDTRDMLVNNTRFGRHLADAFAGDNDDNGAEPRHAVVLMRGHGFTVQGAGVVNVVFRAVYTQKNAGIQTTALLTRSAHSQILGGNLDSDGSGASSSGVQYLSAEEAEGASEMAKWSAGRPWRLWLREVEAQAIYVNEA